MAAQVLPTLPDPPRSVLVPLSNLPTLGETAYHFSRASEKNGELSLNFVSPFWTPKGWGESYSSNWWPTVYQAYEAAKFIGEGPERARIIESIRRAPMDNRLSVVSDLVQRNQHLLRADWLDIRKGVLYTLLLCKFIAGHGLRVLLQSTQEGKKFIYNSDNTEWGRNYWGNGDNLLGNLLGEVRTFVQDEAQVQRFVADHDPKIKQ